MQVYDSMVIVMTYLHQAGSGCYCAISKLTQYNLNGFVVVHTFCTNSLHATLHLKLHGVDTMYLLVYFNVGYCLIKIYNGLIKTYYNNIRSGH